MPEITTGIKLMYTCPTCGKEQVAEIGKYAISVSGYDCGTCGSHHANVEHDVTCECGEHHTLVLYRDSLYRA